MTKILHGNSEKSFLECEKNWLQETSSSTFTHKFFHVHILIHVDNKTVFLVQFQLFEKLTHAN